MRETELLYGDLDGGSGVFSEGGSKNVAVTSGRVVLKAAVVEQKVIWVETVRGELCGEDLRGNIAK